LGRIKRITEEEIVEDSMLRAIKFTLKALGLHKIAWRFVIFLVSIKPQVTCKRGGIRYSLDLRELIDLYTYIGGWEPETIRFLNENLKKNGVVIEVGANIGAHTLIISRNVGPNGSVYAFEPTSYARNKLLTNIRLNPDLASNIVVREEFVTNILQEPQLLEINSSWRIDKNSREPEKITPKSITIDELCKSANLNNVSLIKIDVDGYDYKVLSGALGTIKRFKPIVFIELCEYALQAKGDSILKIFSDLAQLGYAGFYEDGTKIDCVSDAIRTVGMNTSINAIFRPN